MGTMICENDSAMSRHFVPLSLLLFYPPAKVQVDTYLASGRGGTPVRYTPAAHPPSVADLDRLIANGVKSLYVPSGQVESFREQLTPLSSRGDKLSTVVRLEIAKEQSKSTFANAWRRSEADQLVRQAEVLADAMLAACAGNDSLNGHLMSLLHHDGDTFSHITNVCTYALLLAQSLGTNDRPSLLEVGTAALLHDIGKRSVSCDILRKADKLNYAEQRALADHPRRGFEELCHRADMSQGQLLMVYQHHERLDGSGYPVGIDQRDIHWMASVCMVVDVFDALTTNRPYRKAITAAEALENLDNEARCRLDKEMVKCWKSIVWKGISSPG